MNNPKKRPPLKWAGGKQRILPTILPHLSGSGRLIEPFVGSGSVFMSAGERDLVISDTNAHLVTMYNLIQEDVQKFITVAEPLFSSAHHSEEAYARNRARFNGASSPIEHAALLLYLNKFGFNGLFRVNRQGYFNVPYGHPKTLPTFPREQLLALATRLQGAQIMFTDFASTMAMAGPGDIVYCDPPYVDTSDSRKSFTGYTAGSFSMHDQARLAHAARAAATRGAKVVISNHDCEASRALYHGMEIHSFDVRRSVAASADKRVAVKELVAVCHPCGTTQDIDLKDQYHTRRRKTNVRFKRFEPAIEIV